MPRRRGILEVGHPSLTGHLSSCRIREDSIRVPRSPAHACCLPARRFDRPLRPDRVRRPATRAAGCHGDRADRGAGHDGEGPDPQPGRPAHASAGGQPDTRRGRGHRAAWRPACQRHRQRHRGCRGHGAHRRIGRRLLLRGQPDHGRADAAHGQLRPDPDGSAVDQRRRRLRLRRARTSGSLSIASWGRIPARRARCSSTTA